MVNLYQSFAAHATLLDILPQIQDAALASSSCPFQTYAQSLPTFSQVIASLGNENSRCSEPCFLDGCSLYDSYALYNSPANVDVAVIDTAP